MLRRFKARPSSMLGLDISQTSIKILELSTKGKKTCIKAYARGILPPHVDDKEITNLIQKLLSSIQVTSFCAVLAIPDSMVISKIIHLVEGLNDLEIEELVFHEASKLLVTNANEISVDFVILGPSTKHSGMLDILLVIAKTETVEKRIQIASNAGLNVMVVDIESYAFARAIQQLIIQDNLPLFQNKIVAFIDIDSFFMRFCVIQNEQIIYTNSETLSLKQPTEVSQNQVQITPKELGLPDLRSDDELLVRHFSSLRDPIDLHTLKEEVVLNPEESLRKNYEHKIFHSFIEGIFLSIKRNLQFFFAQCVGLNINQIYLIGEGAVFTTLALLIQEEIKIATKVINPLKKFAVAHHSNGEVSTPLGSSFLVAFGLALRRPLC